MNKSVFCLFSGVGGAIVGATIMKRIMKKENNKMASMLDKSQAFYMIMLKWVKVKQEGKSISKYLYYKGYQNIAIYGVGYVGERLAVELQDSEVNVKYGIDSNADNKHLQFPVFRPIDKLETVDAIIVTPVFCFNSIEKMLKDKVPSPILAMDDMLYDL